MKQHVVPFEFKILFACGSQMAKSVLIADDHEVVRLGLKNLLQGTECEVVAEAMTGEQALELVATKKPDLLILDVKNVGR